MKSQQQADELRGCAGILFMLASVASAFAVVALLTDLDEQMIAVIAGWWS